MKKIWTLVCTVYLICMASNAIAAFDLKPYMYMEDSVYPIDAQTMLVMNQLEESYEIELRGSGETLCRISVPRQDEFFSPFLREDGRIGFIVGQEYGYIDVDTRFFLMDRDGTLSQTYDLDDDLRYLRAWESGFAGLLRTDAGQKLVVMNEYGQTLFSREYTAFEDEHIGLFDCVQDRNGTYFAAVSGEVLPTDGAERIILTHFDSDGNVIWENEFAAKYDYDDSVLAGDGEGGVYLVKTDDENYKILQAYYFDANGGMQWAKRIEADGLILSAVFGEVDAASGDLVIDGSVVSKSKGVYQTVRYVVSRQGEIVSVASRDFSSRPDYSFTLNRAQDGTIFARSSANYLGTQNTKLVVAPVDALMEARLPTIQMY